MGRLVRVWESALKTAGVLHSEEQLLGINEARKGRKEGRKDY